MRLTANSTSSIAATVRAYTRSLTDGDEVVVIYDAGEFVVPVEPRSTAGKTYFCRLSRRIRRRGTAVARRRDGIHLVVASECFFGQPTDRLGSLARHRHPFAIHVRRQLHLNVGRNRAAIWRTLLQLAYDCNATVASA